ncbi:MAG: Gfo/Idh/MocA family oxidoreductase [Abitibacteriaceae bacterium]|nr:Gfo/Idh/MocA family oxidoreductase [Abditibacteriaceae bacterium]
MPIQTMNQEITRREFMKVAGYTAAATLVQSALVQAQPRPVPLTLALVGGAHIHTPSYINEMKNRANAKVKYAWDRDPQRAAKRANELKCRMAISPNEIWSDPEVTGVVICSETNQHHDLVLAAANAKKHMFVEKPLGITARDSADMAAAIEKANLIFTTGYFMRTNPQHIFLKDQVAQGNFGKITRIRGSNVHNGSLGGWFDGEYRWMADPKIAGVGAFGDLGTHSLDILMWLLGDVDAVTADINVVTGRYGNCDESGEALLRFKNGVAGTLAAGWVDVDNPVTLLISGTEGHASIERGNLYFKSSKVPNANGSEPWKTLPPGLPAPIQQWMDAIEGKPAPGLVTPREAAARVSVMEAAYQSARSQSWARVA